MRLRNSAPAGAECGFEAEAFGDALLPLLAAEWAAAADGCAHGVEFGVGLASEKGTGTICSEDCAN